MTIKELQKYCHDNAVKHGFWDDEKNNDVYVKIALFHSEISEFFEDIRSGRNPKDAFYMESKPQQWTRYDIGYIERLKKKRSKLLPNLKDAKPVGPAIELADLAIRLLDCCEAWGIDLEKMIMIKMKYNEQRPFKHGGKQV